MEDPYFSIITPTYNRAKFLTKTIQSVINQSFQNWEYIIIDDASTDNSSEIIKSFNDERIVYVKNDLNIERSASRNKAISLAKGKYICFLDSDDEYLSMHLDVLYKNISENHELIGLFYTTSFQEFNNGEIHKRPFELINENNKTGYILINTFNHNCIAVHKNILKEFTYDIILYCLEDLDLWLHVALKYPIKQITEYTNVLHFHEDSFTIGDPERYVKELRNFKYIFNKKEFINDLPEKEKKILLSKTHYKLALKYENDKHYKKMYSSIFKSFLLYPPGYNKNTNKPMITMFFYHLPIIGNVIKTAVRLLKHKV
jgi:glycosyltransferase involved in cell wall biosynthesis